MTLATDCVRCGETFEPAAHPTGYVSEMCPSCRVVVQAEAGPLDEATAYAVDRALEWEAAPAIACLDDGAHVAECDVDDALDRADIDEPDCKTWNALVATFDGMDLDPAVRRDIHEMMIHAWAGGAEAQAEAARNCEGSDAYEEFITALGAADLTPTERQDIEDHVGAHIRYRIGMEIADDEHRSECARAARLDIVQARESLNSIRQHAGTDVMPLTRLLGELAALADRLGAVEHHLTEAFD